jgi:peptidoglycan/LPS O-acetylase OafA/YrhL
VLAVAERLRSHESAFRADIEGFRGIAVLLVVAFHADMPGLSGGFIGVDVFFVLSGFLITNLIVREIASNGRLDLVRFYGRRARRLMPALGVVVVATLIAGAFVYPAMDRAVFSQAAKATSLYASNLWFMGRGLDYFAEDQSSNVFLHTWSLAVEEQFYIFWPALIALTFGKSKSRRWLAAMLLSVSVLSLIGCVLLTPRRNMWAFFGSPARAWEFGFGGVLCILPDFGEKHRTLRRAIGWGGLAALVGAGLVLTRGTRFPGFAALLPVLGTVAVLIANDAGGPLKTFLANKPLLWIGRRSYSWYLWHWPVLLMIGALLPDATWIAKAAGVIASLALADLTFRLVENPVRFNPYLMSRPLLSVLLAVFVPAIGFATATWAGWDASRTLSRPDQRQFEAAMADKSAIYQLGCVGVWGESKVRRCVFGEPDTSRTVVLMGDSHAAQWFPAVERLAREQHWRLVTFLRVSCPVARVDAYIPRLHRTERECSEWREKALADIVAMSPAAVILSNSEGYVRQPHRPGGVVSAEEWARGLRSTLSYLNENRVRVALIADIPVFPRSVPQCMSRATESGRVAVEACSSPAERAIQLATRKVEAEIMAGTTHNLFADVNDLFCDGSTCKPVYHGQVAYFDTNHLTATVARELAGRLGEKIVPFVNQ